MYFCTYPVIYLGVVKGKIEITTKEGVCAPNMIFLVCSIIKLFSTDKTGFTDAQPPQLIKLL